MPDPLDFIWSHAEAQEPFFAEPALRIMLGSGLDQLIAAGFLVLAESADSIACPACLDRHVEEVVVLECPDSSRRFFVACPKYMRVAVPPELLRQWTVVWQTLARTVAMSLALRGQCTSLIDGRLWRLGRTKWKDVSRDVVFARGLAWPDGETIAAQVARSTRPIVFVGDRVPPADIWPGRVPPIVALSQVTALCDNGLTVDQDAVFSAIVDTDNAPTLPIAAGNLALMIRRQIKAEEKTQLTDDLIVSAYQQEGSVRKAAAFLTERTGQVVTKDKVQNALRRSGGIKAVISSKNRGKFGAVSGERRSM